MADKIFNKTEIQNLIESLSLRDNKNSGFLFFDVNDEPIAFSIGNDVLDSHLNPMMCIDGSHLLSWDKSKKIGYIEGNRVLNPDGKLLYTFIMA